MDLSNVRYDSTRNLIFVHGTEYTVKVQRGRYYIHADNKQITVTDVVLRPHQEHDPVFDYVFKGGSVRYPCPAMDYWIYRHRMGNKITVSDYKEKFNIQTALKVNDRDKGMRGDAGLWFLRTSSWEGRKKLYSPVR